MIVSMPAAEFTLETPNSTEKEETTTSLAEMPEISATAICHRPSPAGASTGTRKRPMAAPKLSEGSVTIPRMPKFRTNQITMEAKKMVVPAFVR